MVDSYSLANSEWAQTFPKLVAAVPDDGTRLRWYGFFLVPAMGSCPRGERSLPGRRRAPWPMKRESFPLFPPLLLSLCEVPVFWIMLGLFTAPDPYFRPLVCRVVGHYVSAGRFVLVAVSRVTRHPSLAGEDGRRRASLACSFSPLPPLSSPCRLILS